jgi:cytoskeletal protein CcmA (bactofilin family)
MPIDQILRGLALRIDTSVDPETQPLLEYSFIEDNTQRILARIRATPQPDGGGQLTFDTNAGAGSMTPRLVIDRKGYVGIGIESPAARLDVIGDAKFRGPLSVQGALRVDGVAQISGDLSVTGKLTAAGFAGDATGLSNVTPADSSVTSAQLALDATSLSKVTDGKMVISGGNVGVGTENPAAKLDVAGDAKFKGPLQVQGTLTVSGEARIDAVGVGGNGRIGQISIDDANGKNTIMIGGPQGAGRIGVGGNSSRGQVAIFDENTNFTINLGGTEGAARIGLGGNGSIGTIDVFDAATKHTIRIGSAQGPGRIGLGGNGSDGVIDVFDANSKQTIKVNGKTGKVEVSNADCAEEFDILQTEQIEPGMVMVLGEEGKLERSRKAYDRRVVGVISGAGDYKPGIVLDKQQSDKIRDPISLLGKVYCRVDTRYGAIEVGDPLTTSFTPGHAMKAEDPLKAFGAVIGKALRPLAQGQGLIPILIALQ